MHFAPSHFLIGEYLSFTMPLPRRSSSSFFFFLLLSSSFFLLSSFFFLTSSFFSLRSRLASRLASQVPAGCVGGGSRCPFSSAIRADWCVRVSSIDDGIKGIKGIKGKEGRGGGKEERGGRESPSIFGGRIEADRVCTGGMQL